MDYRHERTFARFPSALDWLEKKPLVPEPVLLRGMRSSLRKSIDKVETFRDDQRWQPAISVSPLRTALRKKRMMPLRDIAAPLVKWAPGEAAALRVPRADASAATVATAALRMVDALQAHAALLRSAGIKRDFLREMQREARALALADRTRRAKAAKRSRATRGIATEISKALRTLVVIRGILTIHAPHLVSHWNAVTRPTKPTGRPRTIRRRRRRSDG